MDPLAFNSLRTMEIWAMQGKDALLLCFLSSRIVMNLVQDYHKKRKDMKMCQSINALKTMKANTRSLLTAAITGNELLTENTLMINARKKSVKLRAR